MFKLLQHVRPVTAISSDLVLNRLSANLMLADSALNIVYVNPAVEEMLLGIESDLRRDLPHFNARALLGANIDVFHKRPEHQRRILGNLHGRHRVRIVVGGRVLTFTATSLDDGDGRRLGYAVEWLDVTLEERLAAERASAEAERDAHAAMLQSIITNSQSMIHVKDLAGHYVLVNPAFEKAMSVEAGDLLGSGDDYLDDDAAAAWAANDRRAREGAVHVDEYAEVPGGRRLFEAVKFPLNNAQGELYATCGVALDVTDLRTAMKAAEEARDEALRQSRVKSEFLATMSHEIRTPMNGVIGLADLMLSTDLSPVQRRYAGGIHAAGKALLDVINDILDFSKFEAGKMSIEETDFDLRVVVEEVAALVAPEAAAKGLTLATRWGPGTPTMVRGDGGRLRQVVVNLMGNAIKFTATGGVTQSIDLVPQPSDDTGAFSIRIEVSDTGIGIAEKDAQRLFEPFVQADSSSTRNYGGTGLGLAISRQLTRAMGGSIGVDSVLGQGSTFWFTVRLRPALCGGSEVPDAAVPQAGDLRVLVVDSRAGGAGLVEQLSRSQLRPTVVEADDLEAALGGLGQAALRGRPFDVLVVDADEPAVDVTDLVTRISGDPLTSAVHVIILHADQSDVTAPARSTAVSYLAKPFEPAQLYACLAGASVRIRSSRAESAGQGTVPMSAVEDPPVAAPASPTPGAAHVLLVEDNDLNQMVAVGLLTRFGYRADVAGDGLEALAKAGECTYDAVLMDCRMPRMDGFQATAEWRRREQGARHTPIIAMTASAHAEDRQQCLAAGMDDYITKPVDPGTLEAALSRWIAQAKSRAVSPPP